MESTSKIHQNEEAEVLEQNEGSIASRLRSRSKVGDVNTYQTRSSRGNNQTGNRRLSRHRKDKSNNNFVTEPGEHIQTGKRSDSNQIIEVPDLRQSLPSMQNSKETQETTKITNMSNTGGPSSYDVGKEKKKATPLQELMKTQPVHYIRKKGFAKKTSSPCWNCALCGKSMAEFTNEEEKHSSHERSLFWHEGEELSGSRLPEAAVLPCSHVFHNTCLQLQPTDLTDPLCPICVGML